MNGRDGHITTEITQSSGRREGPNHLKDKKDYLLKLKDSIDIPIACIRCRKYGHHVIDCRKEEKAKKE